MEQVFEFVKNHWILCSAATMLLIMLIMEEMKGKVGGATKVSAKDLVMLLNREDTITLDLRSKNNFKEGHILGSINVETDNIEKNSKKINKNKTIVLVDNDGTKTSEAEKKLKELGFTKIHSLTGGIASWRNAQLPLDKKK